MIFLKLLAFFAVLIGIGMLLMMIFAGNPTIVDIILIVTVSIGALAIVDLAVFFIKLICKTEKIKNHWKSFVSLLIASTGALLIGVVFKVFLPNLPLADTVSYGLSIALLIAATVNLIYNVLYMLFGTGKLTIPWKLFIFFLILTCIFGTVYIFSDYLSEKFLNDSDMITIVSLMSLSVSILLAVASLLAAIVNGIYSGKSINSLFKLFLSLIIISASLFGVSGIYHLINKPWRNILLYTSGAVLLVGVGVLIVIVFRSIFFDKPFYRNENFQNVVYNSESDGESVTEGTDVTLRKWVCCNCNAENSLTAKFCYQCGTKKSEENSTVDQNF